MKSITRPGLLLCLGILSTACMSAPDKALATPNFFVETATPSPAASPSSAAPSAVLPTPTLTSETRTISEIYNLGDVNFLPADIKLGSASVAAADFNADGIPDLASGSQPELIILTGDGAGHFTASSRVPGGSQPDHIAPADLDQDGDIDLAVANHDTHHLTLLLGDGQGGFRPASHSPLQIGVSPHPHVVKASDLDLDGILDLLVDHRDGQGLLILRGLGDARFDSPGSLVGAGGDPYRGFAVGDIDADGRPDLLTPNPHEIGVLINDSVPGQITFTLAAPVPAQAPFAIELADINADGVLDLISAADESSPLVQLFLGDGQGRFEQAKYSPIRFASGGKSITSGDFNADGFADAAVASYQHAQVLVILGSQESITTGYLPGGEHPWGLAAADFNQDGRDDLLVPDDGSRIAALYLSQKNK